VTPAIITEAEGVNFALPVMRQEFPTNNTELRLRWLPVGTVSTTLAAFLTAVTKDAVEYHNPGTDTPLQFDTLNNLTIRIRPYDDLLPSSGSIVVILTDLLHAGGVSSLNSPSLQTGSQMILSQSNPYTVLSTTALQLAATDAVNLAVDVLITGHSGPGPA
jgi:hypothetical protein